MMPVDGALRTWYISIPFKGDEKICSRCPDHAPFSDHNALIKHIRFVHKVRLVEFKCLICSSSFEFLKKANKHVAKIHPDHQSSVEDPSGPSTRKKQLVDRIRSRSLSDGGLKV